MPVKTITYDDNSSMTTTGCGFSDNFGYKILPVFKMGAGNRLGNYTGNGDAVIGWPNGYDVDGDLIISCGWNDGITIRQLNNNGSITQLYGTSTPLSPRTSYQYYNNIAVSKTQKKFVVMSRSASGYAIYDYSNVKVNGTVTQEEVGQYLVNTDGVAVDVAGESYYSGLVCAGDWVYVGDRDATHYKKFPRRNLSDGTEEVLDGSSIINRNGYRYSLQYDEVNDRVYYFPYYNANFTMIDNASTDNPSIVWCDVALHGYGDDNYEDVFFIPDPVNEPNVLYVSTGSYIAKFDITPCVDGTSTKPTLLVSRVAPYTTIHGNLFTNIFRGGCKYQSTSGDATDRMISNPSGWFPLCSDRGQCELDGWYDMENNRFVAFYNTSRIKEDTTTFSRGRSYNTDYSSPPFSMKSADGTRYYIKFGYAGSDGYRYSVWDDSYGLGLIGNWEFEFGPISFNNINYVSITGDSFIVPAGCSLSFFISVDNGENWVSYDYNNSEDKYFQTPGNQLKFKVVATGLENKAPYYSSNKPINIVYASKYQVRIPGIEDVSTKITKFKLSGAR